MASQTDAGSPGGEEKRDAAGENGGEAGALSDANGVQVKLAASVVARDWGTSRAYVSKCVQNGCPLDSLEAARAWREKNSKYGVGYRSKGAPAGGPAPEDPAPAAGPAPAPKPAKSAPPATLAETRSHATPEESLQAAIDVEAAAYGRVVTAYKGKLDAQLAVAIQAYNRALSNRLDSAKKVQEWMEREEQLITVDKAKEMIRKALSPLLTRLRSLPKTAAIRVNPSDDVHAEKVLKEFVESIIAEARLEYAAP